MVNKVILIGNLGADPEIRYTQKGTQVANFRIATTERWRGQDGQMQEQTEWHSIVAWDKLAEICGARGISIVRNLIGPYITSLEMQGFSITLLKVDDEILKFWDAKAITPGLRMG